MAHYTRQKNSDMDEERPVSPTSEILSESGGAVTFLSPSFRYQIKSTSILSGRTLLEKILALIILLLSIVTIVLILVTISVKKETKINMYLSHLLDNNASTQPEYCMSRDCVKAAASIIRSSDFTVDPCEDFYKYACGGWEIENPIPDGKPSWSTFGKLWQGNQQTMRQILEQSVDQIPNDCVSCKKAIHYYQSCFDSNGTLELLGGQPLLEVLEEFYWNVTDFDGSGQLDNFTLQAVLQKVQHGYNVGGFFAWNVGEDDKNSSLHVLQIDQGGLTLRFRDYYLNKTENDKILNALLEVMVETTTMLYMDKKNISSINQIVQADIRRQMQDILEFETRLAEISSPASEQRDEERRYHFFTVEELQNISGFIEWEEFFMNALHLVDLKINKSQPIIVYSPQYLTQLNDLINNYTSTDEGRNTLNNYLMWQLIRNYKSALSKRYREVDKLLKEAMMGTNVHDERWRQCITDTDNVLGFSLGAMFVNRTFDGNSKPAVEAMIQEVTEAFIKVLHDKPWIDSQTKREAEEKAKKITNMIGYPNYILNTTALNNKYAKLDIDEDYFGNNVRFNRWTLEENLSELSKPVEKNKWGMTPPTINAYYTPTKNQIVFPAGILQEPFFSLHNPKSLNFGAMGVVMGHELSHAFDDQGREYDGEGNMRGWWQNQTLIEYNMRVGCMEDLYGNFTINGENVNGKQTVGENIADNGGLKASYEAYQNWLKNNPGGELGKLPGINLTHNQLFFLSFGQVWCSVSTPQTDHFSLIEDAHSPPRLRVLGTLSNSKYFAETYQCKTGSRMNPGDEATCTVW